MITPEQLRNHARFGLPLTKEKLLEIANRLDAADKLPETTLDPVIGMAWCGREGAAAK